MLRKLTGKLVLSVTSRRESVCYNALQGKSWSQDTVSFVPGNDQKCLRMIKNTVKLYTSQFKFLHISTHLGMKTPKDLGSGKAEEVPDLH